MNRNQLADIVADRTRMSAQQADAAILAALDAIAAAVAAGETVALAGFGTFERRHRAARTGRNPRTGEPLDIPAAQAPAFKPAAAFRRRVTGG